MPQLLSCRSITKAYGVRPLFEELSFGISSEDRLGIIGPNGAGKTTLLRILAGNEIPDKGELTVARGLHTGYLEQEEQFSRAMTVRQMLQASISEEQLDEQQQEKRLAAAAGIVGSPALGRPVSELSGGWRKRLAIACQLIREPQLLLLDEPTNHLDLEGIEWLEKFLVQAPFALALVSHDRTFLENVATRIIEISPRFPNGFFTVEGSYSRYLEKREDYLSAINRHEESLANSVRREMEWLRRGPKARGTKASARIGEAQRMIRELEESRSRSRLKSSVEFDFTASGRRTKQLLEAENLGKSFDGKELFRGLDLVLSPGSRVGLLGRNGSGKTTLLNILAGRLEPDTGRLEHAPQVKRVLFDQGRESLDLGATLCRTLAPDSDSVTFQGRSLHIASYAARFLFRGEALHQPVGSLSGGEQARLLIARLMLQPADILLLDEPTNDLDIDTLEVLEESLEEFPGAVVLVTHDRLMLNRICSTLIGMEPGREAAAYADYQQWIERKPGQKTKAATKDSKPPQKKAGQGLQKKLSFKEIREWEQMEETIARAEAEVARCEADVADQAVTADAARLREACSRLDEAHQTVHRLYARWMELEERQRGEET